MSLTKLDSARRVMAGTWGQVWLDGELVGECYGLQAKMAYDKENVALCGQMAGDKKVMGISGTGSLRMHKATSRMGQLLAEQIRAGKDPRFTILSKLADPDAYGAERVALYNVSFDDLTLADWEAKSVGKVEAPFTFTDFEYLDMVTV